MARPRYCHECQTCLISLTSESLCVRCEERRQIPWSARTVDRCSMCKRIRPVTDFPLDRNHNRALTCTACHARRCDSYREEKGELISREGRARRFTRAQRVVEKALRARIREEKRKERWLETREQWARGELTEGWGITRAQIESFKRGEEYREGPYRQWGGYTDPREEGPGEGEGFIDREGNSGGLAERERFTDREGSWEEGFIGREESQEGFTDREGSWEGLAEREEGVIGRESPQEQFCSSCTQKKPLIEFSRFLTCNACRQRNTKANRARHAKQKAILNKNS
jgi:hypothetical protein